MVEGLGDYLEEMAPDVRFFGPCKKAARLEGSKVYTKAICRKYGIPTASYEVAHTTAEAFEAIGKRKAPIVVKTDGLAAGKGVTVAMTIEQAYKAVDDIMAEWPDSPIVIEEMLLGTECSVMAICDGTLSLELELAQDYKRLRPGAEGPDNPNTGGMGAYSPVTVGPVNRGLIRKQIIEPLLRAMREEGCPYKGLLYAGIMITAKGPMLLEVNCRFGDPETQVVLPRLESDIVPYFIAAADGTLGSMAPLMWSKDHAVCVNMVSEGYPDSNKYVIGVPINGLDFVHAEDADGEYLFHAGTKMVGEDQWVTNGGRVLNVVGIGSDLKAAAEIAYGIIECISWKGEYHRTDIGQ